MTTRTSRPLYVAFSGGKDSTALALLMPDAIPVFTDTGWEFDALYAHVAKFEAVTGRAVRRLCADETLPQYIRRARFLPNHGARFCTRMFKIDVMNRQLGAGEFCIGLRADEPEDLRVGNLTDNPDIHIRYPLREMGITLVDVLRICLDHDLLPRALPYMARGGCKGCFYKRKAEVEAMHRLVPAELDDLQALEESVQDERGDYFYMFPNIGMSIRRFREALDAQDTLFDLNALYAQAAERDDVGAACGLLCHR